MTECASGITGDASGNDTGHNRQFGGNLKQASFARQPAGDQFDDVAEPPGG
jgi:hypothetical protein